MDSKKYLEDISEIKNMMSRSSRFISLSGLSGILAGVYALIGGYLGYLILYPSSWTFDTYEEIKLSILSVAAGVVFFAVITAFILTYKKANKSGEKIWDASSKRLLVNFLIPLITGGIFILLLIRLQYWVLIAPATLIFYGMACLNASKYTLGDVRYLGITNIILGLISAYFIGYGLWFWILGFGVCHIIYGTLMYFKYDRR
ncbi:hypothetical protein [Flagellimonas meridianipacifica]|uniref:Uncharacterized protein n=1 Tax=Flagellimonas meridianipacifica TaxID=1080225 RepID=A0A2T0M8R4_9FLAO|nr:hypothetical protein [Allomuricauda pacifica]PRX53865.1 hypothetical protein CLV81_2255 [Allomuricauda pacifica]